MIFPGVSVNVGSMAMVGVAVEVAVLVISAVSCSWGDGEVAAGWIVSGCMGWAVVFWQLATRVPNNITIRILLIAVFMLLPLI